MTSEQNVCATRTLRGKRSYAVGFTHYKIINLHIWDTPVGVEISTVIPHPSSLILPIDGGVYQPSKT